MSVGLLSTSIAKRGRGYFSTSVDKENRGEQNAWPVSIRPYSYLPLGGALIDASRPYSTFALVIAVAPNFWVTQRPLVNEAGMTKRRIMKYKFTAALLLLMALFLAVAPNAVASTTRYVNGDTGSDSNNCLSPTTACKTIGHAISLAASGDSIMVAAATYTENLTIGFSLRIFGSGASTTIIDGGGQNTVVSIPNTGARVTLSEVAIRDGLAASGGGIYNAGTLTISDSILIANSADAYGGGGIYNKGALTIKNCTLSRNSASNPTIFSGASGGGIYNAGTLTINNSTLSNNSMTAKDIALASGGGISNLGMLTITSSTFSGNSAATGGGISNYDTSPASLQNSIVANSPTGGNCSGTMTSKGYNLSSDGSCDFDGPGDLNNTNPMLGPLANNGGPTKTMALLPGSPAIDSGNSSGCTDGLGHLLKTDQRGDPRPNIEDTGGCDRGAYERQSD
jgi:hypothetical protein